MKTYKKKRITQETVESLTCNNCGMIEVQDLNLNFQTHSFHVFHGYGDKLDGEFHEFELCSYCYNKIINKFKIPVDRFRSLDD